MEVVRAKHRPYIPVVLSRSEVEAVLSHLETPYHLVALLLYGCGLRLSECLELRVQCFNLEAMLLTVHDGKGQKDARSRCHDAFCRERVWSPSYTRPDRGLCNWRPGVGS